MVSLSEIKDKRYDEERHYFIYERYNLIEDSEGKLYIDNKLIYEPSERTVSYFIFKEEYLIIALADSIDHMPSPIFYSFNDIYIISLKNSSIIYCSNLGGVLSKDIIDIDLKTEVVKIKQSGIKNEVSISIEKL